MPVKPSRPCTQPGCPALVSGRESRCIQHRRQPFAGRPSQRERYGPNHAAMRRRVLAEEPFCRMGCGRPSVIADHIIPVSMGGGSGRENYQGLCKACSDAKTAREAAAGARRARG